MIYLGCGMNALAQTTMYAPLASSCWPCWPSDMSSPCIWMAQHTASILTAVSVVANAKCQLPQLSWQVHSLLAKFHIGDMAPLKLNHATSARREAYLTLLTNVTKAGLFKPRLDLLLLKCLWVMLLLVLAFVCGYQGYVIPTALLTALFWQQVNIGNRHMPEGCIA